ncbi:hypothetical protein CHGG_08773 [Chaetomium globosum CBS 148.51]|uniref:Uncharacterized protein n=1 Tax=Chaetomium globosum (strain ATCC 6205 / CBS 148.51 / DSM 1962 / NBRC 6347 / NRRL 1970) TaxID=306901 RepID=Q2GTD1_CHAGB|nr:uncharacterized protein CHGG_08773 [Chaetomium globosum CBS 148.51]EAQ84759.1 hypothetical protein CHGG_08773 [Chaetomium globosum CBS 148.51]
MSGLLLETRKAEADHAEIQHKIDELVCQYDAQEQQALADVDEGSRAIDAQFEKQLAGIAGIEPSLRQSMEAVLKKNRDLEIAALRQTFQERAKQRRKHYDEQRQRYDTELFTAITALITAGPDLSPSHRPAFPVGPSDAFQTTVPAAVISRQSTSTETSPAPPTAAEVPSLPQRTPLPTPTPTEADRQQIPFQTTTAYDAQARSSQNHGGHSQETPTPSAYPRPTVRDHPDQEHPSALRSPAGPASIPGQDNLTEQPAVSASPSPKFDHDLKRKTNGEPTYDSPAQSSRAKRVKLESASEATKPSTGQPPLAGDEEDERSERTITFAQVYGTPEKPASYKHVIVQYPPTTGDFYILRCDEHGVHFGEHPLRGAAKHLASAQHGFMSKAHATAIETLGHRVVDCTKERANQNNQVVLKAFKDGYKAFNANNLSQTRRAEMGYPPLDPLNSQKAALHRKRMAGIINPLPCQFYVTSGGDLKCPVMILPWDDITPAGLMGKLADTGIFRETSEDGRPLGVPKPPKCYVYREEGGRITGIKSWAKGYEDGGPLERKREFPVLCAESADCRMWCVGWVASAHLSNLDFEDPSSRDIPFVREARNYYVTRVLRQPVTAAPQRPRIPPINTTAEDIEMKDAGDMHGDSDRDSVSRGVSAHCSSTLGLQGPLRSGFTAINAGGSADSTASRSARASPEPPSRAGSVSSTGGGHKRVFKIHARSSNRHPTSQAHTSPSMVLPERPADPNMPPNSGPTQAPDDVRKPSPASLQNILQDFPGPTVMAPRPNSQSPRPANARRPLPSGPMRSGSPSRSALLSGVTAKLAQPLRDNRAGSAPVQLPQYKDPVAEEIRLSAAPGPNRHVTIAPAPLPVSAPSSTPAPTLAPSPSPTPAQVPSPTAASEPSQRRDQIPPPIQLPPPQATFPSMLHLNTTPLATPTTSASNTRANSPALGHHSNNNKTGSPNPNNNFSKPETPTLTPTLAQTPTGSSSGGGFLPTMDVFDLAGFMDGDTELFRSAHAGQYLRLIDDHQSGLLTTPSDASVAVRIDPRRVRSVERVSVQGGAVCVVTVVYQAEGEVGGAGGGVGKTQTLVLEKARSTARGMENGALHARRLCKRLSSWNNAVECPTPGFSLDSVKWRFTSQTPTPLSAGPRAGEELK